MFKGEEGETLIKYCVNGCVSESEYVQIHRSRSG